MRARILHTSYVLNFLDVGFDSSRISQILESEVNTILKENSFAELNDWEIKFRAIYTNSRQLLISKNRFGTYPKEKIKEISIPIPIPTIDIISWGITKDQHIYEDTHYDKLLKNFWNLDVNYSDFSSRTNYILDCLRKAIKFCFEEGFTVNGIKVKTK